jgi:hypothetical protein
MAKRFCGNRYALGEGGKVIRDAGSRWSFFFFENQEFCRVVGFGEVGRRTHSTAPSPGHMHEVDAMTPILFDGRSYTLTCVRRVCVSLSLSKTPPPGGQKGALSSGFFFVCSYILHKRNVTRRAPPVRELIRRPTPRRPLSCNAKDRWSRALCRRVGGKGMTFAKT